MLISESVDLTLTLRTCTVCVINIHFSLVDVKSFHVSRVVTWASWRLTSPANMLFVQQLVQADRKVSIKAPHHWPFRTGHHSLPSRKICSAESVSISWHLLALASYLALQFILMGTNKDALSEPVRYANYCKTTICMERAFWTWFIPWITQSPANMKMLDDTMCKPFDIA